MAGGGAATSNLDRPDVLSVTRRVIRKEEKSDRRKMRRTVGTEPARKKSGKAQSAAGARCGVPGGRDDDSFTALTTRRPISLVEVGASDRRTRSAVREPAFSTALTAFSIQAASFSNLEEWRSSNAAERIAPRGFAMPLPAISGAEPCTGSYKPTEPPM